MAIITSNWAQDIILGITLCLLAIYLYLTRNYNYWKKIGVKCISPSFFFGSAKQVILGKQTPYDLIQDIYDSSDGEKLFGFYVLDRPYLLVRDPDLVRHIFVKDFHNFSNRLTASYKNDVLGLYNVFLIKNPPWKQLRSKLTPLFTSGKLKRVFELFLGINNDFQVYCDRLGIDEKVGKPVDIQEACACLMTDFIGVSAYGIRFNSLTDPNAEFRKNGREMLRSTYLRYLELLSVFFVPAFRPIFNPKLFDKKTSDFLLINFREIISERIKTGNKRDDLVDALIQIFENQTDGAHKLDLDQLIAQAAIFFMAGFETSATTMTYTLYELAKNPEMQDRLRKEILTANEEAGGKITYEWATTIPYLDMVINETMRKYPVVAWLDRVAENDYTFPGTNITIKKDTAIMLPAMALQNDPQYWPNPETFDPERFSPENKHNIVPFTYLPFGQGPRNCIGERLGYMQMKLGLIDFIINFEITPCKETPKKVEFDPYKMFTHIAGTVYLNLRKLST